VKLNLDVTLFLLGSSTSWMPSLFIDDPRVTLIPDTSVEYSGADHFPLDVTCTDGGTVSLLFASAVRQQGYFDNVLVSPQIRSKHLALMQYRKALLQSKRCRILHIRHHY